jgi:cytoskeleton protein RodZ
MSGTQAEEPMDNEQAEPAHGALPGVGARLRVARELRQLDIADVAQTLKLGARQVEALENGNWDVLPGPTFVRGFVRNYARLLLIDPAPLMEQLDEALGATAVKLDVPENSHATMPSPGGRGLGRRERTAVFGGLLLLVIAGALYLLLPNDLSALRERAQGLLDSAARKEPPARGPAAPSVPAATPAEPVFPPGATPQQVMNPQAQAPVEMAPAQLASAPAPVASAGDAPLRLVFSAESWVEVRDRGQNVVLSQRGAAGSEQGVSGQAPFSLIIGYAPGVKLFWRGQAVDLAPHSKGEVARLLLE